MRPELQGEQHGPTPAVAATFECAGCGCGYFFPKRPERCTRCGSHTFLDPRQQRKAATELDAILYSLRRVSNDLVYCHTEGIQKSRLRRWRKAKHFLERAQKQVDRAINCIVTGPDTLKPEAAEVRVGSDVEAGLCAAKQRTWSSTDNNSVGGCL